MTNRKGTPPMPEAVSVTDDQRAACRRTVASWVVGQGLGAEDAHLLMQMLGVLPNQNLNSFKIEHVERVQWL